MFQSPIVISILFFFVCFNIFYSKKEWLSFLCVDMGMLGWIMLKSRVS